MQPNHMNINGTLKIRWMLSLFIIGLIVSGATAIPLVREVDLLAPWADRTQITGPLASWLIV